MARGLLALAVTASAAAAQLSTGLVSPPVVSLGLDEALLKKVENTDINGVPCESYGADQDSCKKLLTVPHTSYYAFCEVIKDDATSCPEPTAQAADKQDGVLPVLKTVRLFVESAPKSEPRIVNHVMDSLSYTQRGEYTLSFDATDADGNDADTVIFHFFLVDHVPPSIIAPAPLDLGPTAGLGLPGVERERLITIPSATPTDAYDGLVPETLELSVVNPEGEKHTYARSAKAVVDSSVYGRYELTYLAHDYAGVFGKHYKNNQAILKCSLDVAPGSVHLDCPNPSEETHAYIAGFGTPSPTPVTPTPAPTPFPTLEKVDCKVSEYGPWGECSQTCGGGVRFRDRTVTQKPLHGGQTCQAFPLRQQYNCEGAPCPGGECLYSGWSECTKRCGTGVQYKLCDTDICRKFADGDVETETEQFRRKLFNGVCPETAQRVCNDHACPTLAPTPAWHHDVRYVAPIIVLSTPGGDGRGAAYGCSYCTLARSNPFGVHQNEMKYRAHLANVGLPHDMIALHIRAIVEREEKLATQLGQQFKWWFQTNSLGTDHETKAIEHTIVTKTGHVTTSKTGHDTGTRGAQINVAVGNMQQQSEAYTGAGEAYTGVRRLRAGAV
jgi:hypothetical protein